MPISRWPENTIATICAISWSEPRRARSASRVAVGSVCRRLLEEVGIEICGARQVDRDVEAAPISLPFAEMRERARASDLACLDPDAERKMKEAIHAAAACGRHARRRLRGGRERRDGRPRLAYAMGSEARRSPAGALCSIQAIKAVEIGDGWQAARRAARRCTMHRVRKDGHFHRPTNRAGGLEGGITKRRETSSCAAAMKPIAT